MRVWPVAADAEMVGGNVVCADSELVVHNATGMGAADWFNLDPGRFPCRRWKTYDVDPGREVKLFPSRADPEAEPTLVRVLERTNRGSWDQRASFLMPGGPWAEEQARTFVPQRGRIRLDVAPGAESTFIVCQRAP